MDLSDSDSSDPLSSLAPSPLPQDRREDAPEIICRIKRSQWWAIGLGALEALFLLISPFGIMSAPQPPESIWPLIVVIWPFAFAFSTGVLWLVCDLLRGEIRTGGAGLAWRRGFGRWKKARWDEVINYYQIPLTRPDFRFVETSLGKLRFSDSFESIEQIVEIIPRYATNAGTREWGLRDFQGKSEWKVTLRYWTGSEKWIAPFWSAVLILWCVLSGSTIATTLHKGTGTDWLELTTSLVFLSIPGALSLWLVRVSWQQRRLAWEHRDTRLTLDVRGLRFESDGARVEATWDEVQNVICVGELPSFDLRLRPGEFRVETANGDFSVWSSYLWSRFRRVLAQFAPHAIAELERAEQTQRQRENDLMDERGAWTGTKSGLGARRWSYRARGTRFGLGVVTFGLAVVPLICLVTNDAARFSDTGESAPVSWPLLAVLCGLSAFAIAALWLWFLRACILADAHGLEVRSPFHRPRRASWESIEGRGQDGRGDFLWANGRRLHIAWFCPPVRYEELLDVLREKTNGRVS